MQERRDQSPIANLRWWQTLLLATFVHGIFAFVLVLVPHFSLNALYLGVAMATLSVIISVWNWRKYSWWSRLSTSLMMSLFFFAISARAWSEVFDIIWIWLLPILLLYILAWILPLISPSISQALWREQTAPQTRMGRAFMAIVLALAPLAGVLGAGFGMYGSRFGKAGAVNVVMGVLGLSLTCVLPFATMHQLWPKRPWANIAETEHKGEMEA